MGPADSLGEIALLRRTPRTATVTASTSLHVKILAREEFLAAVTGNPDSAQSADEVISARLRTNGPTSGDKTIRLPVSDITAAA
jgi:CRP-like cAMP-binding protein